MPIEARRPSDPAADADTVGAAYLIESRRTLGDALAKIQHCLDQLGEDDLGWRPFESQNSIRNILLHLCGNVSQWIVHGVGGAPDERDRPGEFADRRPIPRAELARRLSEAVAAADAALAAFPPGRLLEPRSIQGFDCTTLSAILDSVSHFVGHTHQVVYITRLRLGDAYRFQWTPTGIEQGASDDP